MYWDLMRDEIASSAARDACPLPGAGAALGASPGWFWTTGWFAALAAAAGRTIAVFLGINNSGGLTFGSSYRSLRYRFAAAAQNTPNPALQT